MYIFVQCCGAIVGAGILKGAIPNARKKRREEKEKLLLLTFLSINLLFQLSMVLVQLLRITAASSKRGSLSSLSFVRLSLLF